MRERERARAVCGGYIIKLQIFVYTNHILVAHIYIYKVVFENFRFDGALTGIAYLLLLCLNRIENSC